MTYNVSVAGHAFAFQLPEDHPLMNSLSNYTPFRSDVSPDFTLVFQEKSASFHEKGLRILSRQTEGISVALAADEQSWAVGRLFLSADYSMGRLEMEQAWQDSLPACKFALDTALMIQFAFFTAGRETLLLHASAVVHAGKAYAFLGKSGTGKSTHSALWLKAFPGTFLLNDDNPVLRIRPDGTVYLFGSPWSGKTPAYNNSSAPLGALVRLRQSSANQISSLDITEAYLAVSSSVSAFHLRGDEALKQKLHGTLAAVVTNTPVFQLQCRPDEEAARLCRETVER